MAMRLATSPAFTGQSAAHIAVSPGCDTTYGTLAPNGARVP